MAPKSVRLSDIAKRLNLSTVSISKALRDHPDIATDTKNLIVETAKEMGYTPNFMARNLSARRSNTIGVIIPKIAHFFFGAIIESIYDIAFQNKYEIILTVSQENAERELKHIQTLLSMRVDGIIISISQQTKDYSVFNSVTERDVPIVFMDRIPNLPNIDSVYVDDRGGAFKAVDHIIQLGYTKIGHFAGYTEINIGQQRMLGFKEAMEKNNIPINEDWICYGGFGENSGYESFMKLYNSGNLPEVIFSVTYPVALGIYAAAKEVNMRIPEDIDLICFGDARVQKFLSPPLSCINQPTDIIAQKSMEMIFHKINNPDDKTNHNFQIPTDLLLRGTCIGKK